MFGYRIDSINMLFMDNGKNMVNIIIFVYVKYVY